MAVGDGSALSSRLSSELLVIPLELYMRLSNGFSCADRVGICSSGYLIISVFDCNTLFA